MWGNCIMKKILTVFLGIIMSIFILQPSVQTVQADSESLVEYALSWHDNPNIPYVWGGGRSSGTTLESLSKNANTGTDCSGYVSLVYAHFGISIPAQSEDMYSKAKRVIYNQEEAVPGDVCYWNGHVAIYLGNNKIIHTNTSKKPNNLIHVSELGTGYPTPEAYLRMVDNVEVLGTVSDATATEVANTVSSGSIVTESDLTGMPTESSLTFAQTRLEMKGRSGLSESDLKRLTDISSAIDNQKTTTIDIYHKVSSFLGIFLISYGVLMIVAFVFDYINTFVEISLLSILSFGRWHVVSKEDIEEGLVKPGYNKETKKTYLTPTLLMTRAVIVIVIGMFLVSGKLNEWITAIIYRYILKNH